MRTRAALLVSALTIATLGGESLAQTGAATQTPATAPAAKPATPEAAKPATPEPAKPAAPQAAKPASAPAPKPRQLTAEVVSVNQEAKTLTVKRMVAGKPSEVTFTADKAAVASLAELKPGQSVRVTYLDDKGQRTATAIAPVPATAKP